MYSSRPGVTINFAPASIASSTCCVESTVPAPTKANAVKEVYTTDKIDEHCPATIMRKHSNAIMYCDKDSGKFLLEE